MTRSACAGAGPDRTAGAGRIRGALGGFLVLGSSTVSVSARVLAAAGVRAVGRSGRGGEPDRDGFSGRRAARPGGRAGGADGAAWGKGGRPEVPGPARPSGLPDPTRAAAAHRSLGAGGSGGAGPRGPWRPLAHPGEPRTAVSVMGLAGAGRKRAHGGLLGASALRPSSCRPDTGHCIPPGLQHPCRLASFPSAPWPLLGGGREGGGPAGPSPEGQRRGAHQSRGTGMGAHQSRAGPR